MAAVKGLRVDEGLLNFQFTPSIGIVAKNVAKLGLDIRSFREPLKRVIQQVMAPSFKANFDAEGRPDPWEPLSDATLEIMSNMNVQSQGILNRTGRLKRTIQQFNIWTVTTTAASIQSLPQSIWYGYLHQGGATIDTSRGGGQIGQVVHGVKVVGDTIDLPARPFVMIQDQDYDGIEKVFSKWFDERLAAAGLL
jgi:phage gpG-like protein